MTILRVSGQSSGFVRIHQTPCKQGLCRMPSILSASQRSARFIPVLGIGERTARHFSSFSSRGEMRGVPWRDRNGIQRGQRTMIDGAPRPLPLRAASGADIPPQRLLRGREVGERLARLHDAGESFALGRDRVCHSPTRIHVGGARRELARRVNTRLKFLPLLFAEC